MPNGAVSEDVGSSNLDLLMLDIILQMYANISTFWKENLVTKDLMPALIVTFSVNLPLTNLWCLHLNVREPHIITLKNPGFVQYL